MEGRVVFRRLDDTAAGEEDDACALPSLLRGGPLPGPEAGLASRWKISGMEQPAVVSIIWSRSTASRPVRRESASPTVVLPLPGMPIRMRLVISRRS